MKSILIGLLFLSWTALSQPSIPDSTYCLSIEKARLLIGDALRLRVSDSIVSKMEQRTELLESEKLASHKAFTNLLKISEEKYLTQKENTGHMERLALSYKSERDYYLKREKKQRKKKNVLGGALVVVIVLTLIQ